MKINILYIFALSFSLGISQETTKNTWTISPEIVIGKTMTANYRFPERALFKGFFLNIGKEVSDSTLLKKTLNISKTGLMVGVSDFGNQTLLGQSYALLPYFETTVLNINNRPMILQFALGASYQNKGYDPVNNPYNKGISTPLTWSFKGTIYQELFANTSIGLGFYHQSNGHTKFPNQGLNSFFGSIKYDFITNIKSNKKETIFEKKQSFWTFSTRYGLGVNALSLDYNHQKPVHVLGIEFAKTHKNTYKFGFGAYYRFYQQYYDYLNQKGAIAVESYPEMLNSPGLYASNFGINGSVEIFLNHFGVFFDLGLNIYKPFYTIDYKLHQTVQGEDGRVPAEQTFYFDLKKAISTRLGLKYYLYKPNIKQNNNFFVSAAINANLGQADFSEISFGYIKILDF